MDPERLRSLLLLALPWLVILVVDTAMRRVGAVLQRTGVPRLTLAR